MKMIVLFSPSVRAALVFKILKSVCFGNTRATNIDNPWCINNLNNACALLHASRILGKAMTPLLNTACIEN